MSFICFKIRFCCQNYRNVKAIHIYVSFVQYKSYMKLNKIYSNSNNFYIQNILFSERYLPSNTSSPFTYRYVYSYAKAPSNNIKLNMCICSISLTLKISS